MSAPTAPIGEAAAPDTAEDPNARSLRRWEAPEPCPPPSTVEGPDPRIDRAQATVDAMAEQ